MVICTLMDNIMNRLGCKKKTIHLSGVGGIGGEVMTRRYGAFVRELSWSGMHDTMSSAMEI